MQAPASGSTQSDTCTADAMSAAAVRSCGSLVLPLSHQHWNYLQIEETNWGAVQAAPSMRHEAAPQLKSWLLQEPSRYINAQTFLANSTGSSTGRPSISNAWS